MNVLVRYEAYAFVLAFGIALHALLLENQIGVQIATYLPVIVGGLIVAGWEWMDPHRQQSRAQKQEWAQDAIFMAMIQGGASKTRRWGRAVFAVSGLSCAGSHCARMVAGSLAFSVASAGHDGGGWRTLPGPPMGA